ncbi:hypothetical protein IMG5_123520 [Ichthyophthirius multifiliis]|uniref:Furin n=1 Tax=Ichthyophthirius multifiliis TaxID=5932 RepID=G0QVG4_ICHMU|nr:hypothetical protein IMG5_123520 [Ichthyophthirius multifiliis]EGR30792.1 hypothetical protein IMG5_123520 [Ichthyophthirius multifiliis]|eukprot:XP_004032379.1 hypothetical protein IMG5_123520 [Ichthyophthirius multifiliis]
MCLYGSFNKDDVKNCGFLIIGFNGSNPVSSCSTHVLLGGYDVYIEIEISSNLDEDAFNESFGINEFKIIADECMHQCAQCKDSVSCSSCFKGQYLDLGVCSNCISQCEQCSNGTSCDLCKNGFFYNDFQCVSACPNNKYVDNIKRTCNDCNIKCKTCSNATDCETCFLNRELPGCGCPAHNYDNLNYQQACFACSNISDGCSTCNDRTCQECLAPRFLDGNSCVNICPSGKWGNTATRQCTACQAKCVTCSNDNTCDTCFENRVPQQCNCPQYSYDPSAFNQACTMCSTFSTGCATCNATECLTYNVIHAQVQ